MSNKTQLQTNNTKLDTLTSLATSMREKAAALPDAGSGGGAVEFGTFTVNGWNLDYNYDLYQISFMVGQTWREWLSTALSNVFFMNRSGIIFYLHEQNNKVTGYTGGGMPGDLSNSNSSGTAVSLDDIIESKMYYLYVSMGGYA